MNASAANVTLVVASRDSYGKAVVKNVIVVVLGLSINYINVGLISTFSKNQTFYMNPRYILFFHMVLNDMMMLSLSITLLVVSYIIYTLPVPVCATMILLALFSTENTPLNLACMAMECYIAICFPLRHSHICTVKRTWTVIGLIWTTTLLSVLPDLFITLASEQMDFFYTRVFCLRHTVFRNPVIIQKRDFTYIIYLVIVWLIIFCTYFKILFTAKMASKDSKKARNTILLHGFQVLLCMATYIDPVIKTALQKWFPRDNTDYLFVTYILVQIVPRAISPITYGVRDQTFRRHLKKYLLCKVTLPKGPSL